tara:strand:- start:28078 stop:28662 length:585 start_codon:yes stop_codon:yes gene_type:complete
MDKFSKEYVQVNIRKDDKTGCWLWTKYYGVFAPLRVIQGPHRMVYNIYRGGWLGSNIYLFQTCEDKRCVNPEHMEERHAPGNPGAERECDAWGIGSDLTFKRGIANPKTKLTTDNVQTIKGCLTCGFPQNMLAEYFKTNRSTIHSIRHNKTWSHVPWPSKKDSVRLATIWCKTQKIGAELERMSAILDKLSKKK